LDKVDIHIALRHLFERLNVSFTIAPEVQGAVTVESSNLPFEIALQHLLRQVDATYRIEAGVYEIGLRMVDRLPKGGGSHAPRG